MHDRTRRERIHVDERGCARVWVGRADRFAAVGRSDDESNPFSGHGWMCRLVDAGMLQAGGFKRVRKPLVLL
jgi:hypothetical protein